MIRYALRCNDGHEFEAWYASAGDFDRLKTAGHVSCIECGSAEVEKALMAPGVAASRKRSTDLARPTREQAIAELRKQVEANSEYVGMNFAAEARKIHEGEAPERSIYGQARADEARSLIEDGVPVAPLPFIPRAKTN